VLVLRLGAGISYESRLEFRGAEGLPPPPSVKESPARVQSSIIATPVEGFQRLIQAAKYFLQINFTRVRDTIMRFNLAGSSLHHRAGSILAAAEALHPTAPRPKVLSKTIPGGNNYWPRQTGLASMPVSGRSRTELTSLRCLIRDRIRQEHRRSHGCLCRIIVAVSPLCVGPTIERPRTCY
jgi:hypothetical protein